MYFMRSLHSGYLVKDKVLSVDAVEVLKRADTLHTISREQSWFSHMRGPFKGRLTSKSNRHSSWRNTPWRIHIWLHFLKGHFEKKKALWGWLISSSAYAAKCIKLRRWSATANQAEKQLVPAWTGRPGLDLNSTVPRAAWDLATINYH